MSLGPTRDQQRTTAGRHLVTLGMVICLAGIMLAGVNWMVEAQPMESVTTSTVFVEGFEGANVSNNWQLTGHTAFITEPRWLLVTNNISFGKSHSGSKAMWFGDPWNGQYGGVGCDNCPVYSGSLTYKGAPIFVPSADTYAFLSFWSWEFTEMSELGTPQQPIHDLCYLKPTCPWDVRQVWVTTSTLDSGWVLKWDTSRDPTLIPEQQWHQVYLNIAEFKGQSIRVRFEFSTDPFPADGLDGRNNDGRGWYVDDIRVFTFTPSNFVYMPLIHKSG